MGQFPPYMNRPKNFRVYFLLAALAIGGVVLLLREHRPSFLRPDLHLSAYVTTADGNVTVVDLVKLQAVARIPVGPGLSGMREHPTRPELFGASTTGGSRSWPSLPPQQSPWHNVGAAAAKPPPLSTGFTPCPHRHAEPV